MAGSNKIDFETLAPYDSVVQWFGNPDWGLGLPFPTLMAYLAGYAELLGAVALLFGFALRWMAIPMMVTMVVAAVTVHWQYGWPAIADPNAPAIFLTDRINESADKLAAAKSLLQAHGNYGWLKSSGNFVILNNGIEFAATYFVMLLSLFFTGAGRFFSLDYWIYQVFRR
jgi:uncharacterized membrane protein YphA (DoxX/SURF4 family)